MLILLFVAWGALSGLRAGLALALSSLAGVIAGWAVAAAFTGQALAQADARWGIVDRLADSLRGLLPASPASLPIPASYRRQLAVRLAEPVAEPVASAAPVPPGLPEQLPELLAWGIASALTFLLLFAATRVVFALLGRALHVALDSFALKPLNRLAGAAFAAARNLVIAALALGLLVPAAVIGPFTWIHGLVDASAYAPLLLQVFYMVNPWILGAPPGAGP